MLPRPATPPPYTCRHGTFTHSDTTSCCYTHSLTLHPLHMLSTWTHVVHAWGCSHPLHMLSMWTHVVHAWGCSHPLHMLSTWTHVVHARDCSHPLHMLSKWTHVCSTCMPSACTCSVQTITSKFIYLRRPTSLGCPGASLPPQRPSSSC